MRPHCYGGICHRVRSVEEVTRLIGQGEDTIASFYDEAGQDRNSTPAPSRHPASASMPIAQGGFPVRSTLTEPSFCSGIRRMDAPPTFALTISGRSIGTRTLDVTRRIAEDLGFHRGGVTTLRVIVISAATTPTPAIVATGEYAATPAASRSLTEKEVASLAGDLISDARDRDRAIAAQTVKTSRRDCRSSDANGDYSDRNRSGNA